jgi:hypothetical protein
MLTKFSYCITIVSALVLYLVLARENKQRAAAEFNDDDRDKMAFQDLTDRENPYFRYML